MSIRALLLAFTAGLAAAVGAANTYTVTSTADSGAGSLRQAMLDANANAGPDTIAFSIVGSGVHTIAPASALPAITSPVTIDGYTQAGSSPNTQPVGQGLNTVLTVEINGAGVLSDCFTVSGSDTTIKGLVINRCSVDIRLSAGSFSNNKIEGNFIGTDPTGTQRLDVGFAKQVYITSQTNASVGGATPAARNLFAACQKAVDIDGTPSGHVIAGNLIGLTKAGDALLTPACGTTTFSIDVDGSGTLIGGPGAGNVVAGGANGIFLTGSGHVIQGNFVGTDVTGTLDLGNSRRGIGAHGTDVTIGGVAPGEGNLIAFNGLTFGGGGVVVTGQQIRIRGNRIYQNKPTTQSNGFGIDLYAGSVEGLTPNDAGDGDAGPNGLQNFPILIFAGPAAPQGSGTRVQGILNSTASTTFDIDFYSNPACAPRPQEYVEGEDYIGSTQVTTDGSGNASFDVALPAEVESGARIAATATDPSGNTSEFSQRLIASMFPGAGPPAGGTNVTITGMLFADGAVVTIGGAPAGNVDVASPTQIAATTPPLSAGTLNNVVVTNPDGTGGTLANGWIADFSDVPNNQQFYFHISKLVSNAITVGCGTGIYCPTNSVTRQQMAVFLLKSMNGLCYFPPPCAGAFPDVPCSSPFAPWIEALAASGITGGCGGGLYCPANAVTRQQMAVFLLKAKHGSSFLPPACSGDFTDVTCPSQFADWIEQLAAEGITGGCGGSNYCPTLAVRRDQMAAFLYNTFQFP